MEASRCWSAQGGNAPFQFIRSKHQQTLMPCSMERFFRPTWPTRHPCRLSCDMCRVFKRCARVCFEVNAEHFQPKLSAANLPFLQKQISNTPPMRTLRSKAIFRGHARRQIGRNVSTAIGCVQVNVCNYALTASHHTMQSNAVSLARVMCALNGLNIPFRLPRWSWPRERESFTLCVTVSTQSTSHRTGP